MINAYPRYTYPRYTYLRYTHPRYTLDSGIDVEQEINVGPGKFG